MSLNGCLGPTERGAWRGVGRKGWQRVGEGLAEGWRRVGGFPCTLQFRNCRGARRARLETLVCDSMALRPTFFVRKVWVLNWSFLLPRVEVATAQGLDNLGARQKGDSKWEKPVSAKICGFLRFPAENLRFSAQIYDSQTP